MFQFGHKTKVLAYDGAVEQQLGVILQGLGAEKVLLVTDKGLCDTGLIDTVTQYIEDAGIDVVLFSDVLPDPPTGVIDQCIKIIDEEGVNVLLGVGGGSSIDTAKAVNMMKFGKKPLHEMADKLEGVPNSGLPLVVIPTTSGTASEITFAAVITNEETNRKMALIAMSYCPEVALLDPQMTKGMPPFITRATGLDAFAHAMEAYTTNCTNVLCDAIAEKALKMIVENLPKAMENGDDLDARLDMSIAAMMAGVSFNNTYLHLGHAFGHGLGALYHIPHGNAIACVLPWVMEYVADSIGNKARVLCEICGANTANVAEKDIPALLRDVLIDFNDKLGEKRFAQYDLFTRADLDLMAEKVMLEQLMIPFSPKRLGKDEALTILTRAYDHIRD